MILHKLKFGLSYHGDLVLDVDNKWHNLGYNYLSKLPIMLFLNHKQNNFGNLFSKINMPEMNSEYIEDYELEVILEKANELSKRLPLSIKEFNYEININCLSRFNDGLFNEAYDFSTDENKILLLSKSYKDYESKEIILRLDKKNSESLAEKYFKFITDTIKLEKFRWHLNRIVSGLA